MKLSKYVLVMAGLMTSAGAMAGNTLVSGGNGTVTINGTITNATCDVSLASSTISFDFNKPVIAGAAADGLVGTNESPVNIKNCANTPVNLTVTANTKDASDPLSGFFGTGDDDNALRYQVGLKEQTGVVNGGDVSDAPGYHIVNLNGQADSVPLTIRSSTPDYTVTLATLVKRNGAGDITNLGGTDGKISGSYSYNFTYQ